MTWSLFSPQQQGLRMPTPQGLPSADLFSVNPASRSGINLPSTDNFRVPMPQQGSMGLQMPQQMPMGMVPNQQGFRVPAGLGDQMNAPLQKYAQPSTGMNPMAMMQLANMGQSMMQPSPQPQMPPAYRSPIQEFNPFSPFRAGR